MAAVANPSVLKTMPYKPSGYHRLASVMSQDANIAIFRRFQELNMLRLLSLQAEIFDLQGHFQFQCQSDDSSNDPLEVQYSRYFLELRKSGKSASGHQWQMLTELGIKLDEYMQQLSSIESPRKSQLAVLRDWLQDSKGGSCFQMGREARLWDGNLEKDFVTLRANDGENDIFTVWITKLIVGIFRRCCGCGGRVVDEESQLLSYDDSILNTASTIIATVMSSVLPVVTILVLYAVKNTVKRICITIGFTAVFAAFLAIFSTARRIEIFAATATFAAVEVVFIGSALSS
ncbi:uncharacterized protein BP5553_05390 [Venustampulla echinocandica]|uniref:DUF6594 domain-containing protein n=1 Tax=Venustampulla echinocandica TaxID=2656787 RepID=A0A370TR15_9HELO|nr:uncharacterized protein BP5553_05390 [Venustampulla echinocandica]RDL37957.1 hypothetical protein BP5553_05390 [Venustampulla echinocandica]